MSKTQESLTDKNDKIDYQRIVNKYPWILEKGQNCILSPDSDGLLCGLFMSHFLDWKIKGFYDGKVMLLEKDISVKNCVFLDMEIFRKEIKSVGHHMVLYNKNKKPNNWSNFKNSIQPNIFREYDGYKNFQSKYPLATIHILIGIIETKIKVKIPLSAICPLLYTDGVFKNLFGYPENCINWLKYLKADKKETALNAIFFNEHYSIYSLMVALEDFFKQIKKINKNNKRGNDKIKISNTKGEPINIEKENGVFSIISDEKNKSQCFLKILSDLTGWEYKKANWSWDNFQLKKFCKNNIRPNNKNFEILMKQNPVSLAMTSGLAIEYTTDPQNILLK